MRRYSPIALLLAMSFTVSAQTVYKQVDKEGKVTYTDKPPSEEQAAQKVDIDTERNIAKPLGNRPGQAKESADSQLKRRADSDAAFEKEVAQARAKLDLAKDELEKGREPQEDDWKTVGAQAGKPARILNEAYFDKVKQLEEAVRQAEEELDKARSNSSPKKIEDQKQSKPNPRRSSES
jgi:Domain of unknown function (DUF4124)